jgi:hypothetical protein
MAKHHNQQPIPREKKPQGSLWNEINALHVTCSDMTQSPADISILLRATDVHPYIPNMGEFVSLARTLQGDVDRFNAELAAIGAKHLGKQGNTNNPDQLMAAIAIHEEYLAWIDQYSNTVIPTVRQLTDIGRAAVAAKENAEKTAAEAAAG